MGIFRDFTKEAAGKNAKEVAAVRDADQARNDAAMQAVSSSLMVADENNVIVKVNPAAMRMMQRAEEELRKELPGFSASEMVGKNIDQFHKHPQHQRRLLSELNSTYETNISVGKTHFSLIANPIFNEQRERIGTIVEWCDTTERRALEEKEKQMRELENAQASEFRRIKLALDQVASNVMIADADNIIVYANSAVLNMLSGAERKLRTELPNFEVSKIVGSSVDVFHKNPAHQTAMLAKLQSTYTTEIIIAEQHYRLKATPINSEDGERIGTVVEWTDFTDEVDFYNSLNSVLSGALEGDLGERIKLSSKATEFFESTANNINAILDIFDTVIKDVSQSVGALSEGRLTEKMQGDYAGDFAALKDAVNQSIERILSVVTEISESSARVKNSAGEISDGNSNLSARTEQQAASLEETSSAMEEVTATVQQNAENSIQANTLARGARETAESGGSVVGRAVSAMQAISDSSNKITDIIGVIDEIAFQTNLLALNAAVEAARAGDQGRGFAVVADEVRSLAGRSATAAKEIKDLIKDSSEKVSEGSELVNRSGETLDEIVTAVKKVNDIVAEIATASDEQSTGLNEINKAIVEMDSMTQQNAALVEEAAAASESMSDQADNLDKLISFFVTGVETMEAGLRNTVASSRKPAKPLGTGRSAMKSSPAGKVERPSAKKNAEPAAPSSEDGSDEWEAF